jgi:predicted DNA-binding ribbon-helix-helix protein
VSRPKKRSFNIRGHQTSISLEPEFWEVLREIAEHEGAALAGLVAEIDAQRADTNLSSAVRVWILSRLRAQANIPQDRTATSGRFKTN